MPPKSGFEVCTTFSSESESWMSRRTRRRLSPAPRFVSSSTRLPAADHQLDREAAAPDLSGPRAVADHAAGAPRASAADAAHGAVRPADPCLRLAELQSDHPRHIGGDVVDLREVEDDLEVAVLAPEDVDLVRRRIVDLPYPLLVAPPRAELAGFYNFRRSYSTGHAQEPSPAPGAGDPKKPRPN
jgi:hypothetical protein